MSRFDLAKKQKQHNRKAQNIGAYSGYMLFSMIATVIAKVIGFVREIMITGRFGYGTVSDGYILGFSVPDLVYSILIGGAISSAVTPLLSASIEKDEEEKVWPSISSFFTLILVVFFAFMLIGEVFAPQLVSIINPDKDPVVLDIASSVSRVVFLQTFFFILISIISSALSANKVYGLPALADSVYNFFCLIAIVFLGAASKEGAIKVAWGIVFAALMYFAYVFYFARPYMQNFRPRLKLNDKRMWYIMWLAVPALLSGTVNQLNVIAQQSYSNQFSGAVTSLRNATTLYNLPYQIIVITLGTFLLPNMSGFLAKQEIKSASNFLSKTIKLALFLLVPAAIIFLVFSEETIQAVYQWNKNSYTDANVAATASLLKILAVNLIVLAFIYFINQVFYSVQKNYVTLINSAVSLILNVIFCELYINHLGMGIEGLAYASLSGNLIAMLVAFMFMRKIISNLKIENFAMFLLKSAVGAFFSFSVLFLAKTILPYHDAKILQLIQYVFVFGLGFATYIFAAILMQMEEVQSIVNMVKGLFTKIFPKKELANDTE